MTASSTTTEERARLYREEQARLDVERDARRRRRERQVLISAGTACALGMVLSAMIATAEGWRLQLFAAAGYIATWLIQRWRWGHMRGLGIVTAFGFGLCALFGDVWFIGWIGFPITGVLIGIWVEQQRT